MEQIRYIREIVLDVTIKQQEKIRFSDSLRYRLEIAIAVYVLSGLQYTQMQCKIHQLKKLL